MPHIVLVNPQIPPNTGNIARLCAAFKYPLHLIKPLGFLLDNKYLKRAGLDYWPYVDWQVHENFETYWQKNQKQRHLFFSTKTKKSYFEINFLKDDRLVFGSETKGIDEKILKKNWEHTYTIPMKSTHVRSLNLASAVSLVCSEALRQT